jgi:hypothetical protein
MVACKILYRGPTTQSSASHATLDWPRCEEAGAKTHVLRNWASAEHIHTSRWREVRLKRSLAGLYRYSVWRYLVIRHDLPAINSQPATVIDTTSYNRAESMSELSTVTWTNTHISSSEFLAETFTETVTHTSATTTTVIEPDTSLNAPPGSAFVVELITLEHLVDAPYTCDNILEYGYNKDITANPDIAGIGVCATLLHRQTSVILI